VVSNHDYGWQLNDPVYQEKLLRYNIRLDTALTAAELHLISGRKTGSETWAASHPFNKDTLITAVVCPCPPRFISASIVAGAKTSSFWRETLARDIRSVDVQPLTDYA